MERAGRRVWWRRSAASQSGAVPCARIAVQPCEPAPCVCSSATVPSSDCALSVGCCALLCKPPLLSPLLSPSADFTSQRECASSLRGWAWRSSHSQHTVRRSTARGERGRARGGWIARTLTSADGIVIACSCARSRLLYPAYMRHMHSESRLRLLRSDGPLSTRKRHRARIARRVHRAVATGEPAELSKLPCESLVW